MSLPAGYELIEGLPDVDTYRHLRTVSGLSPRTSAQAAPVSAGSWAACHILDTSMTPVSMGRVIGDGGWYFHLADIATHPDHQRKGLGAAVVTHLIDAIRASAPANPYVTLLADAPGRGLYERLGFRESAPESIGMVLDVSE